MFGHLISVDAPEFRWTGRSRRPPLDRLNALLSFLYTLLVHDCRAACVAVGLDPAVGFLHRDRPGRPGLALDLMEELRPVLADHLVLSPINRRQIGPSDFTSAETGAVTLTDEARRTVIAAWQERRKDRIHPFLHLGSGPDATTTPGGTRRLRQVAKACRDFGQQVQFSVFEIEVDPAQWAFLKARLELIIDASSDSLRFYYYLGSGWIRRVGHVGAKPATDFGGPFIV